MKRIIAAVREVAFLVGFFFLILVVVGPLYSIIVLPLITDSLEPIVRNRTMYETDVTFGLLVAIVATPVYIFWRIWRSIRRKTARTEAAD